MLSPAAFAGPLVGPLRVSTVRAVSTVHDDHGAPFMTGAALELVGRDAELAMLRGFRAEMARSAGALLLAGDPGVGKTALLRAAAADAAAAGMRVLAASGTPFEAKHSFSCLHQLLHPVGEQIGWLGPAHRQALQVALGIQDCEPPSLLMIANAVLDLLRQLATEDSVLLIVDDLQWIDRASAMVLAVVARRLTRGLGLLAAYRSGHETFFDRAGLPEYEIRPLDETAAAALVAQRFPALVPRVRGRLLAEAQGNPLALLELPLALTDRQQTGVGSLPDVLALNRRLQAAFAARIDGLPPQTRRILLLAALDGSGLLSNLIAGEPDLVALAAAERAGLIHVDDRAGRLTFHHPLTRSAVVEGSMFDERIRAHAQLAAAMADRPERAAWHLAQASTGPDETVARLLEDAAYTVRSRGDAAGAVTTLLRAADLSPTDTDRSRRLAEAAYLGALVTGDLRDVPRLLAGDGHPSGEQSLVTAVAAAHHLLLSGEGDIGTAHRLLAGAIQMQAVPYDGDNPTMVEALYTLGWVCYFSGQADLWEPFHAALSRLSPPTPELLALLAGTFDDPARTAAPLLDRLDAAIVGLSVQTDAVWTIRVTLAAMFLDRLTSCRTPLSAILGREPGPGLTLTLHARSLLGLDQFMTGEWDAVRRIAEEHVELCQAHDYRLLECIGLYLLAMLAAAHGDHEQVRQLTDRMTIWATPRGAGLVLRIAEQAKLLDALGRADFGQAYQHATTIATVGQMPAHIPHGLWLIMDVVEAAARTGRIAEARAHVAAARDCRVAAISPRLAMTIEAAAALAAPDDQAPALFDAALAVSGGQRWPFERARIQLAYGERLRRSKANAAARRHLATALETFDRLGALPWSARASAELRATGHTVGGLPSTGPAALTPQQRQIAELAAAGLSNKQIGEKLFLSPRTVGTHLYQIFPKLGITSRAALRDAIADTSHLT
ncbi:LuxR family transcriptional regulator [Dactylosporangium maewongense]|uniref:LuxR family transcriptional regulator n=1 Tax=Dactylosporangium maewongense TaxID=634393 RepID=A0ABN2D0T8_9ACTN